MLLFLFFCLPIYIHSNITPTNRHRKRRFINVHYSINTNIHAGFFGHNEMRDMRQFRRSYRLCPQRITYTTLHRWNKSYKCTKSRLFTRTVIFNGTVSLLKKDESINSCSTSLLTNPLTRVYDTKWKTGRTKWQKWGYVGPSSMIQVLLKRSLISR